MKASDNDTTVILNDGTYTRIKSSNTFLFTNTNVAGSGLYWANNTTLVANNSGEYGYLGSSITPWQKGFISDSLLVGGKGQGAIIWWGQSRRLTASDSCGVLTMSGGNPVISLYATDADQSQITVNTYDQMLFQNASGGYAFDSMVRNRDADSDTFAVNPKGFSATNTMATGAIALQLKDGATNLANIDTTGKMTLAGDLVYGFIHFVGSADSVAVTPTVTQYVYTKLLPGITAHETGGVTFAADSLTILTSGDYVCNISITLSGTNANDYWRIKVYKNNAALPNTGANSIGRFSFRTTANNQTDTRSYLWYLKDLAINDVLSWRITNLSASRNPTITDMKIYFYKAPE